MKITFCGAAGEVTGSQHLIECDGLRILLDCGMFQGHRSESRRKNMQFFHKPELLDAVILSHAHTDHCGNLPGLYKAGFRGPVYCTGATRDIASIMLDDSLKIQLEDARYINRKLPKQMHVEPLYELPHVRGIVKEFSPIPYGKWKNLFKNFKLRFRDAGHILGSAICEMEFMDQGESKRLVFTGDLGRRELPLTRDPELVDGCDVLITESTYGNRVHPPADDIKKDLLRIIKTACETKGKVIIPAFALGRTQQLVYFLNELTNSGELPPIPIYVDSPLSMRITDVYRDHADEVMDIEVQRELRQDQDVFGFKHLTYVQSQQESMALNHRPGPFVVISASGMCESGRVLHHLKHSVEDPTTTIVIIGFQAENTLGRRIVEKQPRIRIYDREFSLRANVEILNGLSAHADVQDFKWWFSNMASTGGIGQAFLVHGEAKSATALSLILPDYCDLPPIIPQLHQSFEV